MSSMTLKEFMTRGNEGMEKRGADFQFNVNGGSEPFVTWNNDKGYNTNLAQTELINYLVPLYNGSGKEYWSGVDDYTKQRLLYELSSVLHDVVPKVLGGDKELLGRLDKSSALKTILSHLGVNSKPSEFITQSISEMTKDSNFRKFMLGAYKKNSGLVGSFADKYIIQSLMKKMGLDPSKVYDYAPGLRAYDMNQHLPGMALAFGLPFGIGAIAGKPGLGLLLGLLGAGGYGYYKYNQMAGEVPDRADNESPFSTPPSSNYLSQPVSTEKTKALPDPLEEQPNPTSGSAPTASDTEDGDAELAAVALDEDVDSDDSTLSPPTDAGQSPVEIPQLDPLTGNDTVNPNEHELHIPWRVVNRDKSGKPVSLWNAKDGMYTFDPWLNQWYQGDGQGWRKGKAATPGMTSALNEAAGGKYILNQNIAGLPEGTMFMDELGTVYDGSKNVVGKAVNGGFVPSNEVPYEHWNMSGEEILTTPSQQQNTQPGDRVWVVPRGRKRNTNHEGRVAVQPRRGSQKNQVMTDTSPATEPPAPPVPQNNAPANPTNQVSSQYPQHAPNFIPGFVS